MLYKIKGNRSTLEIDLLFQFGNVKSYGFFELSQSDK